MEQQLPIVLIPTDKKGLWKNLTSGRYITGEEPSWQSVLMDKLESTQFLVLNTEASVKQGDCYYSQLSGTIGFAVKSAKGNISLNKVIAAFPTIIGVNPVDIADINKWIENGCGDSIVLEQVCECNCPGFPLSTSCMERNHCLIPKLTGNKVTCVWGEETKLKLSELPLGAEFIYPEDNAKIVYIKAFEGRCPHRKCYSVNRKGTSLSWLVDGNREVKYSPENSVFGRKYEQPTSQPQQEDKYSLVDYIQGGKADKNYGIGNAGDIAERNKLVEDAADKIAKELTNAYYGNPQDRTLFKKYDSKNEPYYQSGTDFEEVFARVAYQLGWKAHEQQQEQQILKLMSQSFEGWSQEAINGYTTAMSSVLGRTILSGDRAQ